MIAKDVFSKVAQGVNKLTQHTLSEATKAKDKILDGQTQDEVISFSSLWELPEPVDICRGCDNKFQTRKHHCRSCGGVFCDDCSSQVVPTDFDKTTIPSTLKVQPGSTVRLCLGCRKAECPNFLIRNKIRSELDKEIESGTTSNFEKFQQKIAAKVGEAVGIAGDIKQGSKVLKLYRGSYYGENNMERKNGSRPIAVSGYFEIYNKSNEIFAVKLVVSGGNTRFEIPRPTYIAVPPREAIYGFFEGDMELDVVILYDNPHSIASDKAIIYDTRARGVTPEKLSPCARIDLFNKVRVFYISSAGKNVLLKYKGEGLIEPRSGNSMDRVGIFGSLQGKRFAEGKLDYATNIDTVRPVYSVN